MSSQASGISSTPDRFGRIDYLKIAVFGFALTAMWSSLHTIVLPLRLLDFVPESQKNSYLGYLTFAGLVLAMLVQPVVGAISDRSGFAWGRRRPYILMGATAALVFLPAFGLWESYALVFLFYLLLQAASNTAQSSYQGFIPDLVPADRRGQAAGVKSLIELLGGVSVARLAAYFMDLYSLGDGTHWLWVTIAALAAILLAGTTVTMLTVHEGPGIASPRGPFLPGLLNSFKVPVERQHDFVWFLVSRGMMGVPGVVLQTFAIYYLTDVILVDSPAAAAANLLIAVGGGLLVAVYFAGRISDRLGRKPIVVAAGTGGAAGVTLLLFSGSLTMVLVAGVIIGLANGALLSASWALATDLAPGDAGAKYLGLTNLAMAAGSALARLVGPVIDVFNGLEENLGYSVMLLICLVCFAVGALLILKVRHIR